MNDAEKKMVRKLVRRALALDLNLSVNDGEELTLAGSTNERDILAALGTTGMDWLIYRNGSGKRLGTVFLVYGNEPDEVVNDYSWTEGNEALMEQLADTE